MQKSNYHPIFSLSIFQIIYRCQNKLQMSKNLVLEQLSKVQKWSNSMIWATGYPIYLENIVEENQESTQSKWFPLRNDFEDSKSDSYF